RESGPIRVVELPWISVRIGRAAYCEVRLPDTQIAEEACRLTRKGRTWNLIPSSVAGPILLEGRPLNGPCSLPFDVPFRLGASCLTLRHAVAADPDGELYPASAPTVLPESPRFTEPDLSPSVDTEPDTVEGVGTTTAHPADEANSSRLDPDRWRARW